MGIMVTYFEKKKKRLVELVDTMVSKIIIFNDMTVQIRQRKNIFKFLYSSDGRAVVF